MNANQMTTFITSANVGENKNDSENLTTTEDETSVVMVNEPQKDKDAGEEVPPQIEVKEHVRVEVSGDETAEELRANEKLQHLSSTSLHHLPGQWVYHGMLLIESIDLANLGATSEYDILPDDWLICGYPKSGS